MRAPTWPVPGDHHAGNDSPCQSTQRASDNTSTSGADTPDHVTGAGDEKRWVAGTCTSCTVVQWRATRAHRTAPCRWIIHQPLPTIRYNNRRQQWTRHEYLQTDRYLILWQRLRIQELSVEAIRVDGIFKQYFERIFWGACLHFSDNQAGTWILKKNYSTFKESEDEFDTIFLRRLVNGR